MNIYDQKLRDFEFRRGPLFANVVLVEEINRAMPKTQSALLEAMAERQVTIDGQTYVLPQPFLVLATENPIEFEGVFPLPEAQLDRFFLKARLGYPGEEDELAVVLDQQDGHPLDRLQPVASVAELDRLEASLGAIYVDELVRRWTIKLVRATRELPEMSIGALGTRQSRTGAGLPCVGAARRAGLHDPRRRRAHVRPRPRAPARLLPDVHRRVTRPLPGRDRERGLRTLRRGGAAAGPRRRHRGAPDGDVDVAELSFPLVPRWRPVGSAFGRLRAARRGIGSSVATTRSYVPGDDPGLIDWKLSARLSSIRGTAEFIVREDFADEAPRAVVVADHAPSMGLYPDDLPWLSKPAALHSVWQAVGAASAQELGLAGYLDTAAGDCWFAPRPKARYAEIDARGREAPFDADRAGLEAAFDHLARCRRSLPAGTFVFVCSDFLAPPDATTWLRALGVRGTPSPWSCRTRSGSRASRRWTAWSSPSPTL